MFQIVCENFEDVVATTMPTLDTSLSVLSNPSFDLPVGNELSIQQRGFEVGALVVVLLFLGGVAVMSSTTVKRTTA